MKTTGIFLLLSLALCSYQGNAKTDEAAGTGTEADCGNYNPKKGCTKIFDPVCGTDNLLYGNECLLCFQNQEENTVILCEGTIQSNYVRQWAKNNPNLFYRQRKTNVRIKNRGMCEKPSPRSDSTPN